MIMKKVDFVGFIEVRNSNPNGDVDMGNMPRQNDDGYGYMTDACIKRKIRDAVALNMQGAEGYDLYIQNDYVALQTKAMEPVNAMDAEKFEMMSADEKSAYLREYMLKKYFDIRTFGAVITTYTTNKWTDGQVKGPVQISFAESVEPIEPTEITITRVDVSTEKDKAAKDHEMGTKWIVPYGMYRFEGHVSADLANKAGFTDEDLEALLDGIWNMYENNKSAAQSDITVKNLFVFKHDSRLGNCRFSDLDKLIHIERAETPLGKKTYDIHLEGEAPTGVEVKLFG